MRRSEPCPTCGLRRLQPKAGTTWTQQIVHHLRCRAAGVPAEQASAFEEINCVVPFIEMAYDVGIDPLAEQVALPRFEPRFARRRCCRLPSQTLPS